MRFWMPKKDSRYNGILLVNKPTGISSHDLVDEIRKIIRQKKVGHTGTLDQRASGLMIICLGNATKVAQFISNYGKSYIAEVCLGQRSRTFDGEGVYTDQEPRDIPFLDDERINKLLSEFIGTSTQTVPAYSAVRVNGQRLYNYARNGEDVELPDREIHIEEIKLIKYEKPYLTIDVTCSKGTYIRSLANDIGQKLGCGAYLSNLTRSKVGRLSLEKALDLEMIAEYHQDNKLEKSFLKYEQLFDISGFTVNDDFIKGVFNGKQVKKGHIKKINGQFETGDQIALRDTKGTMLAIGVAEIDSDDFSPEMEPCKLFNYTRVLN